MPSISFNPGLHLGYLRGLDWSQRMDVLQLWGYRVGIYAAINLLDEPAWLALMFC